MAARSRVWGLLTRVWTDQRGEVLLGRGTQNQGTTLIVTDDTVSGPQGGAGSAAETPTLSSTVPTSSGGRLGGYALAQALTKKSPSSLPQDLPVKAPQFFTPTTPVTPTTPTTTFTPTQAPAPSAGLDLLSLMTLLGGSGRRY